MRFVHTADWQLGMTRHFLAGEAQPQYSAARRDAVAGLGPLAAQVGAEFVVVAGDVFEDNQLAPKVISQSLEAMRAIGIPVYLLPGNHDPLDASSVYTSALFTAECPANVHVLDQARRPRGSAGPADRRGALAVETADDRPGCRRAGGPAGRRSRPGAGRARRCRRARPRPHQAVADPVGRRGRCVIPWGSALRGARRQAFVDRSGEHRPSVVLRLAGGHQLRRRRGRSRSCADCRRRRDGPATPGERRGRQGRPLAVQHSEPSGGQQPRHRRLGSESGSDAGQGPNGVAAGLDWFVDRHRPRRLGRLPGQVFAAVRLAAGVGQPQRSGGDSGRRRIQRPRHRRVRRRGGRGAG